MNLKLFSLPVALFVLSAHAYEPVAFEPLPAADGLPGDVAVVVTPIPMPAPVTQLLNSPNPAKLVAARKAKVAKVKVFPKSMLSRSEQRQIALLAQSPRLADWKWRKQFQDEDGQGVDDDLAFHRSFSRPRLADESDDQDFDGAALPGEVRLRLLLARMKAVEAHLLASVPDTGDDLPAGVGERLRAARERAVAAHQSRFG
ncbi:MAG: hypothetical protein FIB06_11125 [Betaproteobacteria bacterium]|nr:hypothetical protein [Betaproteobacteria bacterium]